ncbi:hypothetical protein QAD02_014799 [Eretmocerus hayati]|uniref:Uncharacterized protein n=1 Tax=Eretmocerus hayati TaxID=131215 RepID=A0ACC2P6S4_9HYME|nr:hypothetical protein QAD02_014799 [Eretmocerus hayati]
MSEGTSSVDQPFPKSRRGNRAPRKPVGKAQCNADSSGPPKLLIKKRPPRRPKLSNGSVVPCAGIGEAIKNDEMILPAIDDSSNNEVQEISEIETLIDRTEEQVADLQISEELPNIHRPDSASPLPNSSNTGTPQRRVRRPRKRNKAQDDSASCDIKEKSDVMQETATEENTDKVAQIKLKKLKEIQKKAKIKGAKSDISVLEECDLVNLENRSKKDKKSSAKRAFNEHLSLEVVKKLLAVQDPEAPNVIEGVIRINPRCYKNAYISSSNGEPDLLIVGLRDRNRALEGDLVAVIVNSRDKWFPMGENVYQKTGTVISILEKNHPRKAVGYLKKQDVFVFLHPRDSRIPLLKIHPKTVPRNFYDNPELFENELFLCNITDWKKVAFAEGHVLQSVGLKGDLSVETNAILFENDLIVTPYGDELLEGLPPADYAPSESDISNREDLRKTCIFTIDPATAVDLDDALSCTILENGNYEVGVHIADVTHFLEAFSPLDRVVATRATTVYMVDNVYHMLPKQLCMACSLLPGRDKLAFSVILEMNPDAEVINYRFSKTVMNSCCQMSYDQAQIMIDDESYDWEKDGTLKIAGNYKPTDLVKIVKNLYDLSMRLKKRRFDEGALRIDQPKLCVFLDRESGIPTSYKLEEKKESNSLIEEFMLLANMTVAKYLYENLPEFSLLRLHEEPSMRMLAKTRDLLTKFGVLLDVDSAGSLHNSLLMYQFSPYDDLDDSMKVAQYRAMVINNLCAKSMTRAIYKCSADVASKDHLRHYALNAEFYTHFTSPIRRYPDCVVHRLLYASMTNQSLPSEWSAEICSKVAANCNIKKYSAKMAQEQSNALYFTYLLDLHGSMNCLAIVMDVKERSVDTMLCETGLKVRLYFTDTFEETEPAFTLEQGVPTIKLKWIERQITQVITLFSIVHVQVMKHPQSFKLQGIILSPTQD